RTAATAGAGAGTICSAAPGSSCAGGRGHGPGVPAHARTHRAPPTPPNGREIAGTPGPCPRPPWRSRFGVALVGLRRRVAAVSSSPAPAAAVGRPAWVDVLASIDDGVIVLDRAGAVPDLNPAAEQLTGIS